jgi:polysaccharide export outer membrane protein
VSRILFKLILAAALVVGAPLGASAQQARSAPTPPPATAPPRAATAPTVGGVGGGPVGGPITNPVGQPPATTGAAAGAAATPSAPIDSSYMLGSGDIIDLSLVGRGDFGGRARVNTDGTILMPYIGSIKAADHTVMELADIVRQALIKGGYFSDPVVRVEVASISSRYATALGAVGSPGLIPLDRSYRLSEIMAKLGGKGGNGANFVMLTHAGGKPQRYAYDKLASGGPEDDPLVVAGDKIYIPPADAEVFYLSGEVMAPGAYPITDGLTVRMAIAKAGGVTQNGSETKVKITRDGKPLKGVKPDDPIKVGDLVAIGARLF